MSKQDFADTLAYGACEGSVRAVAPNCVDGSPGKEWRRCPVNVTDGHNTEVLCNCCDKCRSNCNCMSAVKEATKHASKLQFKKMKKFVETGEWKDE